MCDLQRLVRPLHKAARGLRTNMKTPYSVILNVVRSSKILCGAQNEILTTVTQNNAY